MADTKNKAAAKDDPKAGEALPPWPGQEEADAIKLGETAEALEADPNAKKRREEREAREEREEREAREKREAKAEEHPAGYKTR